LRADQAGAFRVIYVAARPEADTEQVMTEADGISGQVFASVWDALEDSPAEAANMRLRSELMIAIRQAVAEWSISQAAAARRLEVTQPRLNGLLRGRINNFSLDALTVLAARAGLDVHMRIAKVVA
jgi:predicted XRE-type DNA-binding protein